MTETDLKKLSSEPEELSKVDVVVSAPIESDVHKCSAYPARMKMKLPLQQNNVVKQCQISLLTDFDNCLFFFSSLSHSLYLLAISLT